MTEEPEDQDVLVVLSVEEYLDLQGIDSGHFPVTVEVRNQLSNLLLDSVGTPQYESYKELFSAVMTAVVNLELKLFESKIKSIDANYERLRVESNLQKLRNNTIDTYTRLLDLETRILEAGVPLEESDLKKLKWKRLK